jgi:hypothetical protein
LNPVFKNWRDRSRHRQAQGAFAGLHQHTRRGVQFDFSRLPLAVSTALALAFYDTRYANDTELLILGDPGAIITGRTRDYCRTWPNQREITVKGRHFLQEDSPHEIGRALAAFVRSVHAGTFNAS